MVNIPAENFNMEDSASWGDTEARPLHQVDLKAFALSKYKVTLDDADIAPIPRFSPSHRLLKLLLVEESMSSADVTE